MYMSGVKDLCVVSALRAFRDLAPQRFGQGPEALQPLFRRANGQMLKRTQVQYLLEQAARGVGLPPERFMSPLTPHRGSFGTLPGDGRDRSGEADREMVVVGRPALPSRRRDSSEASRQQEGDCLGPKGAVP